MTDPHASSPKPVDGAPNAMDAALQPSEAVPATSSAVSEATVSRADAVGKVPLAEGPGWTALSEREDLAKYSDGNAIGLFAAELKLGIDDIDTFAADALTDHGNDKSCDMVAVIRDSGQIIVAQNYAAQVPNNKAAGPAGKASDLNGAASWLFTGDLDGLPNTLRDAAIEARDALRNGEISDIQFWSVHNLPEGQNVQAELAQAVKTANSVLGTYFPEAQANVSYAEIGKDTINSLYQRTQLPILVDGTLEFPTAGGFETSGEGWTAYNTAVQLSVLRTYWLKYGTDLMSPNIRDYLGIRRSERNINFGIKVTARENPKDFFVYNNGITAVVHSYSVDGSAKKITVSGMGIVNGGQTTGSIGTLKQDEASLEEAWVQIRFVKSVDSAVLENVVRYNNTQNKVEATDFRSKDAVQERLRTEFDSVPLAVYRGARRGGADDAIKREKQLLSDSAVAQSIASFHGYPNLAYNELRQIWENDPTYSRFFNDNLHARHVVFCYSLLKAIEEAKLKLMATPEDKRTTSQQKQAQFFRSRGGVHLLTAAIGASIETVLGEAVPDRFALRFKENLSPATATANWKPIIQTGLPFANQLMGATNLGMKSQEKVDESLGVFGSMIESMQDTKQETFGAFAKQVEQSTS